MSKGLTDAQISDLTRVMNGFSCIADSIYMAQPCEKDGIETFSCRFYGYYYPLSIADGTYGGNTAFINSLDFVIKNIDSYEITDDWGDFVLKFKSFMPLAALYIQTPFPQGTFQQWLQKMKNVTVGLKALQNAYYKALSTTFAPPQVPMGNIDPGCKPYLGFPLYQELIDVDLRIGAFMTLYEWAQTAVGVYGSLNWQHFDYAAPEMYSASISDSGAAGAMKEIVDKAFGCFPYMKGDWNDFESFMLSLSSTWNEYITNGKLKEGSLQGLKDWLKQMNPIYCEFSCYQQSMVKAVMEIAPPSSGDQKK